MRIKTTLLTVLWGIRCYSWDLSALWRRGWDADEQLKTQSCITLKESVWLGVQVLLKNFGLLSSLSFSYLICKMGMFVPTSWVVKRIK